MSKSNIEKFKVATHTFQKIVDPENLIQTFINRNVSALKLKNTREIALFLGGFLQARNNEFEEDPYLKFVYVHLEDVLEHLLNVLHFNYLDDLEGLEFFLENYFMLDESENYKALSRSEIESFISNFTA